MGQTDSRKNVSDKHDAVRGRNRHWLYRVLSSNTAMCCFGNLNDDKIILDLKHPMAWNPSSDIHNKYAQHIGTYPGPAPDHDGDIAGCVSTVAGLTDATEGTTGNHVFTEPLPGPEGKLDVFVKTCPPFTFIHPKIRAICFSYFYGTKEELLSEIQNMQKEYEKPSCDHDCETQYPDYLYGEVDNMLRSLCGAAFQKPYYFCLTPVLYLERDWKCERTDYTFPRGNSFDSLNYFRRIRSVQRNPETTLFLPSDREAEEAIHTASRHLLKFKHPYGKEKEVRLFVYSPEFSGNADRTCFEKFSVRCVIDRTGIVTSRDCTQMKVA